VEEGLTDETTSAVVPVSASAKTNKYNVTKPLEYREQINLLYINIFHRLYIFE
jgi:hypothetical protein